MRRPGPARIDLLVAGILLALVGLQLAVVHMTAPDRWATAVIGPLVTGSVAVRRRYPALVGMGVQALLSGSNPFFQLPAGPITIGWFCALYALAVWTTTRLFAVGLVVFVVTDVAPAFVNPGNADTVVAFTAGAVAVMVLLRVIVGDRDRRLALAARERELAMREAINTERARVARELHDVIAHYVSMMVVQAGAERRVIGDGQADTREVLSTIEQMGRGALGEMRRLVAILRGDGQDSLAPQPGLVDIPALVAQTRDAGLPVELRVEGEPGDIPLGVDLSAYRIIQEGLTNALRHAGTAPTTVRIYYHHDSIGIDIVDAGRARGHAGGSTAGSGLGLVGIRERVALYGGTLDAGVRPDGGFGLHIVLPTR
jgi:signal transduction histidine kinase